MKEFYFVRHGQTDHNVSEGNLKLDHPEDIALNETGKNQAKSLAGLISSLPIQSICTSPLRRVQETKEIICKNIEAPQLIVQELGECTALIWKEMKKIGMFNQAPPNTVVSQFLEKVQKGFNEALSQKGPTLIVSHGGVHWALCSLLQVYDHPWSIENCATVHFFFKEGKWSAKKLFS